VPRSNDQLCNLTPSTNTNNDTADHRLAGASPQPFGNVVARAINNRRIRSIASGSPLAPRPPSPQSHRIQCSSAGFLV